MRHRHLLLAAVVELKHIKANCCCQPSLLLALIYSLHVCLHVCDSDSDLSLCLLYLLNTKMPTGVHTAIISIFSIICNIVDEQI